MPKILVKLEWGHIEQGRQIHVGRVKVGDFRPISCCISETNQVAIEG